MAYHVSLESVCLLYYFSRQRKHSFLHGLRNFRVGETYMKLTQNSLSTDLQLNVSCT